MVNRCLESQWVRCSARREEEEAPGPLWQSLWVTDSTGIIQAGSGLANEDTF